MRIPKDIQDEIEFRIDRLRAIPDAPGRQLAYDLQDEIEEKLRSLTPIAESGMTQGFIHRMTDIVADESKSNEPLREGWPCLTRLEATRAVGRLIRLRGNKIQSQEREELSRLKTAIATGPEYREGPILTAAFIAALGLTPEAIPAPTFNSPEQIGEVDQRMAMIHVAYEFFSKLGDEKVRLLMPEWRASELNPRPVEPSTSEDNMDPKMVIKLGPRTVFSRRVGQAVDRMVIHSPQMQAIAAVVGVPREHNPFSREGDHVRRNLGIIICQRRLALDEQTGPAAARVQGVRIPPLDVLSQEKQEELSEALAKRNGCLPKDTASELLPGDSLAPVVALRAARRLEAIPPERRIERLKSVLDCEIGVLSLPVVLLKTFGGEQEKVSETTILQECVDELNSQPSRFGSTEIRIDDAANSIRLGATALLSTFFPGSGIVGIRPESEIREIVHQSAVRKVIPPEDLQTNPKLSIFQRDRLKVETIRRKSTPYPRNPVKFGKLR